MNSRTRTRENQLIRSRMVGAEDLLDSMPLVHRLAERLTERGLPGALEANEAYDALERVRGIMYEIAREGRSKERNPKQGE